MRTPRAAQPSPPLRWSSVSDLSEYAYCPRALYYRRHPPPEGPSSESRALRAHGSAWHASALAREAALETTGRGGWLLLLAGAALVLIALGFAGLLG